MSRNTFVSFIRKLSISSHIPSSFPHYKGPSSQHTLPSWASRSSTTSQDSTRWVFAATSDCRSVLNECLCAWKDQTTHSPTAHTEQGTAWGAVPGNQSTHPSYSRADHTVCVFLHDVRSKQQCSGVPFWAVRDLDNTLILDHNV